jgi:hypothetical protein
MGSSIVLSPEEIEAITQYKAPGLQLAELRRQGFYRARIGRKGVVLERGHYDAIVAGRDAATVQKKINLPSLKLA